MMGVILEDDVIEVETQYTGPWEKQSICRSCRHVLEAGIYALGYYTADLTHNEYLRRRDSGAHSLCPHCGESKGLVMTVRRKVFTEPRTHPWWRKLLMLPERERAFEWEVKKPSGEES